MAAESLAFTTQVVSSRSSGKSYVHSAHVVRIDPLTESRKDCISNSQFNIDHAEGSGCTVRAKGDLDFRPEAWNVTEGQVIDFKGENARIVPPKKIQSRFATHNFVPNGEGSRTI
jgi:hypothetical protein